MLLVLGQLTINKDIVDAYEADLNEMIPKVQQEDGCLYYSLCFQDKASGVVSVSEMWTDEPALLTHFTQPWIVEFMNKYGSQVLGSTLKIYDADNERPLPGG